MNASLDNANPIIYECSKEREIRPEDEDDSVIDKIDEREVFDLLRNINDPEHPLTLEELNVVEYRHIQVNDDDNTVVIEFTPTIPHCSMATLIGLSIRVKLLRALPPRFKHLKLALIEDSSTNIEHALRNMFHVNRYVLQVDVRISPGSHASEEAVNKQLADKERVAAALENSHLLEVVNQCLDTKGKHR